MARPCCLYLHYLPFHTAFCCSPVPCTRHPLAVKPYCNWITAGLRRAIAVTIFAHLQSAAVGGKVGQGGAPPRRRRRERSPAWRPHAQAAPLRHGPGRAPAALTPAHGSAAGRHSRVRGPQRRVHPGQRLRRLQRRPYGAPGGPHARPPRPGRSGGRRAHRDGARGGCVQGAGAGEDRGLGGCPALPGGPPHCCRASCGLRQACRGVQGLGCRPGARRSGGGGGGC